MWASKRNCFLMSVSTRRAKLVSKTFLVNVFNKILSGETEGFVRPPAASLEHPLPAALGEFRDAPLLESRIACHATTDALAFWMSS